MTAKIRMINHLNDDFPKDSEQEVSETYAKVLVGQGFAELIAAEEEPAVLVGRGSAEHLGAEKGTA